MPQTNREALFLNLDVQIRSYLYGKISGDVLQEVFSNLPHDWETAMVLCALTDSFDLIEIYQAIFSVYACFVNTEELLDIWSKAKRVFDSEVYKNWEDDLQFMRSDR